MRPVILLHGPTASGKTETAIHVARNLDGEVINADSMQVYKDLQVLTARPTKEELEGAPKHHLFGHRDAAETYSVGTWLDEAIPVIDGIRRRGKAVVVTGGTGLYMSALVNGLSEVPTLGEAQKAKLRAGWKDKPNDELWAAAHEADPEAVKTINTNDRQRLLRILEVKAASGKALSSFHAENEPYLEDGEWIGVTLSPPRKRLYARIDRRFDAMLNEGALAEVESLYKRGVDEALPAMKAHGAPYLLAHLKGEMGMEQAAELARRDTRRYAKRQFTWMARQFPFWTRIPSMKVRERIKVILALYAEIDVRSDEIGK